VSRSRATCRSTERSSEPRFVKQDGEIRRDVSHVVVHRFKGVNLEPIPRAKLQKLLHTHSSTTSKKPSFVASTHLMRFLDLVSET